VQLNGVIATGHDVEATTECKKCVRLSRNLARTRILINL